MGSQELTRLLYVAHADGAPLASKIVPGRSCGSCTQCCKISPLPEVASPRSVYCKHCIPQRGCSIYASRPSLCREFFCNWLLLDELGPEWQPERSKLVLQSLALPGGHQGLFIHADPDFPDGWRTPPYYGRIKDWAAKAERNTKNVGPIYFVLAGVHLRKFLILPDCDVDLGIFEDHEGIEITRCVTNGRIALAAGRHRQNRALRN
jgi:hypothetical protein